MIEEAKAEAQLVDPEFIQAAKNKSAEERTIQDKLAIVKEANRKMDTMIEEMKANEAAANSKQSGDALPELTTEQKVAAVRKANSDLKAAM